MNEHTSSNVWLTVYMQSIKDNSSHAEAMTKATQAVKNCAKVHKLVNGDSTPTE